MKIDNKMLRRRKEVIAEALEATKNLDAFPKLEDDYKETSSTRGTSIYILLIRGFGKLIYFLCFSFTSCFWSYIYSGCF